MPIASICRNAGSAALIAALALTGCAGEPSRPLASNNSTPPALTAKPPVQVAATGHAAPPAAAPQAATPAAAPATAPAAPKPPPAPVPFDQAVVNAADGVLSKLPPGKHLVVIDPLIDGVTGMQTAATKSIQTRIASLAKEKYPEVELVPFTSDAVHQAPIVLVGTFTAVDKDAKTVGPREAYRFCLVALDLAQGTTVAKSVARAFPEGVDATPLAAFGDSPVWTADKQIQAYIASCQQSKVGDPINKSYVDGLVAAALISDAIEAYNHQQYAQARELYTAAKSSPQGDQLRVFNGLYLTNNKLGARRAAEDAFVGLVDYGLETNRLGVKFLFRPGSTGFAFEGNSDYVMWLRDIAQEADKRKSCLEVTGHTSATGTAAINERLSLLRAEYIRVRLAQDAPALGPRMIANGVGSRENLVGTGVDNESDALDRRVEFKVIPSCA
jgi:outer membrane protein OmpA-like peptidoglycan-associated protein